MVRLPEGMAVPDCPLMRLSGLPNTAGWDPRYTWEHEVGHAARWPRLRPGVVHYDNRDHSIVLVNLRLLATFGHTEWLGTETGSTRAHDSKSERDAAHLLL